MLLPTIAIAGGILLFAFASRWFFSERPDHFSSSKAVATQSAQYTHLYSLENLPDIPEGFQHLSRKHPFLLKPYIAVFKARGEMRAYSSQLARERQALENLDKLTGHYEDKRYPFFTPETSPAQRELILQNIPEQ